MFHIWCLLNLCHHLFGLRLENSKKAHYIWIKVQLVELFLFLHNKLYYLYFYILNVIKSRENFLWLDIHFIGTQSIRFLTTKYRMHRISDRPKISGERTVPIKMTLGLRREPISNPWNVTSIILGLEESNWPVELFIRGKRNSILRDQLRNF